MILGMQFCSFPPCPLSNPYIYLSLIVKNAYLLVDYGDYTVNEGITLPPYVQLLSTTNDTAQMHQEFVTVRLNGIDTTNTQKILQSTTSPTHTRLSTADKIKKWIIIGGAILVGVLVILGAVVCLCCFCLRRRGARAQGRRYQPLDEPAPAAASEMHIQENAPPVALPAGYEVEAYHQPTDYQPQYQPPYQAADHHSQLGSQPPQNQYQYQTPYDSHQ